MACASPFWTLMIVAPGWKWTKRIMSSPWSVTPPLIFWFVFALPRMAELIPAVLKPTLGGWQALIADPAALTFVWAQIIAWDLFIGRWIYLDSRKRGINPLVSSPIIALAIGLSPIAVPLYLLIRNRPGLRFTVFEPEARARTTIPAHLADAGPVRRAVFGWHRPLMVATGFSFVVCAISLIGMAVDDRELLGLPIWAKAAKFGLSFGLYTLTLAWMLSLPRRHVKLGQKLGTIAAVTTMIEVGMVALQIIRGTRSHFNIATAFDTTVWVIMAAVVLVLWVANLLTAVFICRERIAAAPELWACRLGTVISLAGMAVAFFMTTSTADQRTQTPRLINGAHSVGVPDGGPGMPVTNWSTTGGDLRVPHFIGIHALQAVPLFAILLTILVVKLPVLRDSLVRVRLVWTFSGFFAGIFLLTTWQALRGQSVIAPDAATLVGVAVLVAGTAVATTWSLRRQAETMPEVPAQKDVEEVLV
ncbi:ABA4-like family protein [Actinophytocola glycyrrhizae]|uniref:ABA4-like family protein n=1 Tax=Actinophytocola glycyrrhizae TaxID=2044873 RepID=A0ABV9RUT8_9PSEU